MSQLAKMRRRDPCADLTQGCRASGTSRYLCGGPRDAPVAKHFDQSGRSAAVRGVEAALGVARRDEERIGARDPLLLRIRERVRHGRNCRARIDRAVSDKSAAPSVLGTVREHLVPQQGNRRRRALDASVDAPAAPWASSIRVRRAAPGARLASCSSPGLQPPTSDSVLGRTRRARSKPGGRRRGRLVWRADLPRGESVDERRAARPEVKVVVGHWSPTMLADAPRCHTADGLAAR